MMILSAKHISHDYVTNSGQPVRAVRDVSLTLEEGTFTTLVGPSGCGKSTLLRILAGLIKPKSGQVLFKETVLSHPQREISVVFQRDNLMPWRTVYQNIVLPLQLAGVSRKEQAQRVEKMLVITRLKGFESAYPSELSGGMAQRVAIGRGLITEPDVLLLDEPFGALDALTREQMWRELLDIWSSTQATVLMVTHSIQEAVFLSDRVLVMSPRPGHVLAEIDVPFPRPRGQDLLADPPFFEIEGRVRGAIQLLK